jgi:hypothetical protein
MFTGSGNGSRLAGMARCGSEWLGCGGDDGKHSPLVRSVLFSGYGVTVGDSGGVSVMAVAARM